MQQFYWLEILKNAPYHYEHGVKYMTLGDLIEELMKIEDKTKEIIIDDYYTVVSIVEDKNNTVHLLKY